MTDLKSADGGEIQNELRELTTTSKKLNGELETVRHKLKNELDVLTYKLDKIAYENEEIRRQVRDINRTIDKLRYDLLDAVRNGKRSEVRDLLSDLLPIFIITFPVLFIVTIFFLYELSR